MLKCVFSWRAAAGAIAVAFVLGPSAASAVQIVLSPASAIGGSGSYGGLGNLTNPWNVGGGAAGFAFDSQGPGPKFESPSTTGFTWEGNDTDTVEYFVIDLGASYVLTGFDIFNSHNTTFNDRSVGPFTITAGNSVSAPGSCETGAGTCGLDLSGPTALLVSGTLLFDPDPINAQSYAASNTQSFRYLRFDALGESVGGVPGGDGVELNELHVFGTVPEPGTLLLLGSGLAGLVIRGRRGGA